MKITLKTLQGKQLPIEVDAGVTIENLKKQIEEEHKMPAESQQLVAYGKVLNEPEKTLGEYNIKDGDFLVVMVKKQAAKKPEKPPAADPKPAEAAPVTNPPATSEPANTAAATNAPATSAPATTEPATSAEPTAANAAAAQLPPEQEETVQMLMSISGKPRETCIQCLAAAFGDPDRAFQYLDGGLPQQMPPGGGAAAMGGGLPGMGAAGLLPPEDESYGNEGSGDPAAGVDQGSVQALMDIAQNPNFQQLRARILQNPQFYNEFMQMLQSQSPDVYAAIQANPQLFMNLILGGNLGAGQGGAPGGGAGAMPGMPAGMPGMPAGMPGMPGMPGGGQPGGQRPGNVISVTQEELAAIERLEALGFNRQRALQAFMACEKNEELAANFLFEQAADDDDDALNQGIAASSEPAATTSAANANQPAASSEAQPANTEAQPEGQQPPAENNSNSEQNNNNNNNNNGDNNEGGAGAGGAEKSAFE